MKLHGDKVLGGAMVAGGLGLILTLGRVVSRRRGRAHGTVVCPASPQADTSELAAGDFVAVALRSPDRKTKVVTWARVRSLRSPIEGSILVRLVGEFGAAGVRTLPKGIGFRLGDDLVIERACIFETFRSARRGTVLCGQWLIDISKAGPVNSSELAVGDQVEIWLAPADEKNPQQPGPGHDVPDPVWAEVLRISNAGHVVHVRVLDAPTNTTGHKVEQGDELDITRECIARIRSAGHG